jgi:hypothetical protein
VHSYVFDHEGEDFGLRVHGHDGLHSIRPWAFDQLCKKLGPAVFGKQRPLPRDYVERNPPWMRKADMNHWRVHLNDNRTRPAKWLVRTYDGEVRAVLSDRYAVVDVTETLEWLKETVDARAKPMTVRPRRHVGADVLHIRVIDRVMNTKGGEYGVGAYLTTGEIGNRKLGIFPGVWSSSCDNSFAVRDDFAFEHIHSGNTGILRSSFINGIVRAMEGSLYLLERLLKAESSTDFENYEKQVDKVIADNGWTEKTRDRILLGTPTGYENLFGLSNGITAAARDETDVTVAADMELFAGGLLG